MTAAAALAKMGHRALLLEQYKTLGGLTHSFSREGFSWDVGIHYLGSVAPDDRERRMIDWLAHTPMAFEPMGAVYDTLHMADAPPLSLSRPYEAQERDLKDRFPDEGDAIEAWIAALRGPAHGCLDLGRRGRFKLQYPVASHYGTFGKT